MLPWPALTFLQSYSCNHDHSLILDNSNGNSTNDSHSLFCSATHSFPSTLVSSHIYVFVSVACFRSVYEWITQHIAFSDCFSYLTFVSSRAEAFADTGFLFLFVCLMWLCYVFLHVYTFVCMYIDMCVYVCSGVRGHHCVLLTPSLINFSKEGLSMNPEFSYAYWPVRPMDPPASASQCWSYRHAPPCLALVWVPASTSGLHVWVESIHWLNRRIAASVTALSVWLICPRISSSHSTHPLLRAGHFHLTLASRAHRDCERGAHFPWTSASVSFWV